MKGSILIVASSLALVAGCRKTEPAPTVPPAPATAPAKAPIVMPKLESVPMPAEKDRVSHWVVVEKGAGLEVEVFVNDAPLFEVNDDAAMFSQWDANTWLLPGVNTLTVRARRHAKTANPDAEPKLLVSIHPALPGTFPTDSEALASYELGANEKPKTLPVDLRLEFTPTQLPPSAFWPRSRPIVLDDAARGALLALVGELHAALSTRDAERFIALSSIKVDEMQRVRYHDAEAVAAWREGVGELLETWNTEPLAPESLDIALVAGGRVAHVTRAGKPALRSVESDGETTIDVFAAPIDGRWVLVR